MYYIHTHTHMLNSILIEMNAIVFESYGFNSKVKKEFNEKNESFIRNCIYSIII